MPPTRVGQAKTMWGAFLLELITEQNNLNYVQSKIYPGVISELCRFCEDEDETFAHLLNECPCFITARRDILRNIPIIKTVKWKPQTLLAFSNIESIDDALKVDQGFWNTAIRWEVQMRYNRVSKFLLFFTHPVFKWLGVNGPGVSLYLPYEDTGHP